MMMLVPSLSIVPIRRQTIHSMDRVKNGALQADGQRRLQRERGRGAAGRRLAQLTRGLSHIKKCAERNQTEFGVKRNHRAVEQRPGGAHPGAEHGAMGRSLVMGMVSGMLDRLSLRQSADGEDATDQHDRNEFKDSVVHQYTTHVTQ